jgi:hypothetical protein
MKKNKDTNNNQNYKMCIIDTKILKKEEYFTELQEKNSNVKELIEDKIKNKSIIYGLEKDNKLKSIYIFAREKNNNQKQLTLNYTLTSNDVDTIIIQDFESKIIEELKELVSMGDYQKVVWNEIEIAPNTIKFWNNSMKIGTMFVLLGLTIYILSGEILWLCLGLIFGTANGAIIKNATPNKKYNNNLKQKNIWNIIFVIIIIVCLLSILYKVVKLFTNI